MKIIRNANKMSPVLSMASLKIGFVPTMGCLHKGHLSLIEKSKSECDLTVCSIFVNPTQFNDPEDFKKYPSTLDADIELLTAQKIDYLYLPSIEEIYPSGYQKKEYDLGYLENVWEGEHRPGHFQGVCQVVDRLLEIVPATDLFLGQKDLQQCLVIKRLLEITDRKKIILHFGSTMRENSGLALSSRNKRLSPEGKQKAKALFAALQQIRFQFQNQNFAKLETMAKVNLFASGFDKIDYLSIVETATLLPAERYNLQKKYSVIAAAWIEGVRLIDNINLN